ncbi:alpha-1,3-glucan synthase [Diplogelasinospora grovesii]|uniref:alpha-1,3-glucan synthase n=1 Tax=Diplogelasinospora grovesii TaxID=303347 RepID=A0AAN6N822_9PEZI|nr:alpha-1,3-glucan synthase [Diplogelasinospora grovesii]
MSILSSLILSLGLGGRLARSLRYDPQFADHNLNQNTSADSPLDYWGKWEDHEFTISPENWRFPVYTLFLDRWVNGNPANDNANDTVFEQDITSTQLRHGGDIQGLIDSLDYIHGMGVKAIYIAGSPFINQPWQSDSYSPLDLTLLDAHFGSISEWRLAVDEIHKRGMYVVMDNTVATMGDLLGFEGYLNESTPFEPAEHNALWKTQRRYLDFDIGTDYNETCEFPRFWNETGFPIEQVYVDQFKGCYNSDFDQFVYPDYRRQITKFASVQDRLREWVPSVREKLEHFSCIAIRMLDIDGFRFDKAIQVTVDASGNFSAVGKNNFFLPGEITVYLGRGRQPDQWLTNHTEAITLTNTSDEKWFWRSPEQGALDAAAFSYSVYRYMTRFLGMDGNLEAGFDLPSNWVSAWWQMVATNDFVNANTGVVDPRHMVGVTNQDVFRWPGIRQGVERMLLGQFITSLLLPGIPLLLWGEEQAFYVLDNTADNYIFGRQAMSASPAWYLHGCYAGSSTQYYDMPLEAARDGCRDIKNSWDHRDPSHPVRNILKSLFHLREQFPVLKDGFYLDQLSNQTSFTYLPGSNGTGTETGIWSVVRMGWPGVQDLGHTPPAWLVYHNKNETTNYTFDCTSVNNSFISPFPVGTKVKNLIFPHDRFTLETEGPKKLYINGSQDFNGCTESMQLDPFEFRVYVPEEFFVPPPPMITKFLPGHDFPVLASTDGPATTTTSVNISIHYSAAMSCDKVTSAIQISSTTTTETGVVGEVDPASIACQDVAMDHAERAPYIGSVASAWTWSATLVNLADGIHKITVLNTSTADLGSFTNSNDSFLLRVGKQDNPIVFPTLANYSSTLLSSDPNGTVWVTHKAPGADMWRYSLNWGSSWSDWQTYAAGNATLASQPWSGTKDQEWQGHHVMVQYFSRLLGSSSFVQHGDAGFSGSGFRRFPHLWANGRFNQFGFDGGYKNTLQHTGDGRWEWHYMDEWPGTVQLNVWGMNPDGQPDQTFIYGDIDGDFVLDRLPPSAMAPVVINVTDSPAYPYLSYRLVVQDATLGYQLVPQGDRRVQVAFFVLMWFAPIGTGLIAVFIFMGSFYKVKIVEKGIKGPTITLSAIMHKPVDKVRSKVSAMKARSRRGSNSSASDFGDGAVGLSDLPPKRRTVLIATVEYNIDDWNIKVKIGGLGVMAQLMGKALGHQDLIWVVPCVGDITYPDVPEERAEPMIVQILDAPYQVSVSYHQVENITYVLLDAPVFRQQTKAEPYPPRMDNIDSAIYYSAWNQCIAQTITRFPVDIYHVNDYHGGVAPLYLLPEITIPCCLSLHNAEFQGLWPLRTPEERKEVCGVFNLPNDIVQQYVQFGSVFNLLHAAVSYLRVHQSGFGAVGVSKKYGDRSFARYPIFWGLSQIGQLPNPDPSDMEQWDAHAKLEKTVKIDEDYERSRGDIRRQAQEWAGLEVNPEAELFVFVGRWSQQKGVDLIADLFPTILEEYPSTQLICIGPTIDLYGKFAALKLSKLMEQYPTRVFSKPEFTSLPPYIFSGAEFALIPSRDEPFGLVAVEFGRKGALGVGAKVGGLGQMPGWWYTIESASTTHLLSQFKQAVVAALESKKDVRAKMRAWSAKQRFPVAQWLEGLEKLQGRSIKMHNKTKMRSSKRSRLKVVSPGLKDGAGAGSLSPSSQRNLTPTTTSMYLGSSRPASPTSGSPNWPLPPASGGGGGSSDFAGGPGFPSSGLHSPAAVLGSPHGRHDSDVDSVYSDTSTLAPPRVVLGGEYSPDPRNSLSPGTGWQGYRSNNQSVASFASVVSVSSIVGDRTDFKLQQVDPFFTDSDGKFIQAFEKKLDRLNSKTSISQLCIEEYLVDSEREFFDRMRDAKLGTTHSRFGSTANLVDDDDDNRRRRRRRRSSGSDFGSGGMAYINQKDEYEKSKAEFGLGDDYVPPTGVRKLLQIRLGEWPVYAMFLAFGQIIASNSYQITLLTGELGQSADKLYIVASIYLVTSIAWGVLSRTTKAVYCLSLPWIFYGFAFLLIGVSPFLGNLASRAWMQNVATGLYAAGSSSGAIFFAFNFGDEGGSPVTTWIWRACVIQGIQQAYTVMLWFWGSIISSSATSGSVAKVGGPVLLPITMVIAVLLWTCGYLVYVGLPDYYRQEPDEVPSLYASLLRRKTTLWFFVAVILQNYFLSSPYGRNWFYLFSSQHVPTWGILLLTAFFFIGVWALFLWFFAVVSKRHPWWLPLFALGLGAPRWCQMLWGISGFGQFLPWAGSAAWSAILGRSLWLWLGLLDTVQNAGLGMILMLTLTRIHVSVAMLVAQVIGSVATMVARATAPNNVGPGDVFPDFSEGLGIALSKVWFWVALAAQLVICAGFFKFFRKEQISKP